MTPIPRFYSHRHRYRGLKGRAEILTACGDTTFSKIFDYFINLVAYFEQLGRRDDTCLGLRSNVIS